MSGRGVPTLGTRLSQERKSIFFLGKKINFLSWESLVPRVGCAAHTFKMEPLARPISVKMIPLARLISPLKVP